MPSLPIDLQTLFSHINQVGKTQAAIKDTALHAQAVQGSEIADKTLAKDKTVNETEEIAQGPETVNDREKQKREKRQSRQKKSEQEKEEVPKKVVFRDPNLGHHIDIVG